MPRRTTTGRWHGWCTTPGQTDGRRFGQDTAGTLTAPELKDLAPLVEQVFTIAPGTRSTPLRAMSAKEWAAMLARVPAALLTTAKRTATTGRRADVAKALFAVLRGAGAPAGDQDGAGGAGMAAAAAAASGGP